MDCYTDDSMLLVKLHRCSLPDLQVGAGAPPHDASRPACCWAAQAPGAAHAWGQSPPRHCALAVKDLCSAASAPAAHHPAHKQPQQPSPSMSLPLMSALRRLAPPAGAPAAPHSGGVGLPGAGRRAGGRGDGGPHHGGHPAPRQHLWLRRREPQHRQQQLCGRHPRWGALRLGLWAGLCRAGAGSRQDLGVLPHDAAVAAHPARALARALVLCWARATCAPMPSFAPPSGPPPQPPSHPSARQAGAPGELPDRGRGCHRA